jgi:hypothetical protein
MKSFALALALTITGFTAVAQSASPKEKTPESSKETQQVEASCGQCNFGLKAPGCDLAVRINGTAYFVDGSDIDSHGDAHAKDGFCSSIRQAKVQGTIIDNRFKATYFQLLPESPKKSKPQKKNSN